MNKSSTCNWLPESFNELKKMIAERVPQGGKRRDAMKMIELSLDPAKALAGEDQMATVWEAHVRSSPASEVYEKRVAEILREIGCAAEGAPYVLRGLLGELELENFPFDVRSPHVPSLAKAFLDEEQCPGAHGLIDSGKAKLKAIRDRPPPPEPTQ